MKISEIINIFETEANPGLAMDWDNSGLQVGSGDWEVEKILLTLDVTKGVIEKAVKEDVDLIISHHPMIFTPLKRINNPHILKLIENRIGVYSAHTNLDVIKGGVNYILAEKLGLKDVEFLSKETGSSLYQISVYVPQSSMDKLAEAVFLNGAGMIGNYNNCLNDYEVSGQFTPLERSKPYIGTKGKLEKVIERKLEFFVDSFNLNSVIKAMKSVHPYETPVYSIVKQSRKSDNFGLGLVGKLEKPVSIKTFSLLVKKRLNAPFVHLWLAEKKEEDKINTVAVCGGSGSSLIREATGKADIFVSGDFTYHKILESRIPLIDAGHFYTENPALSYFRAKLSGLGLAIDEYSQQEHEITRLKVY